MGAAVTKPNWESVVGNATNMKIGELVIDTTKGCRIEFITERAESIVVRIPPGLQAKQIIFSRTILKGDGKSERSAYARNFITVPAMEVTFNGETVRREERGAKSGSVKANGVGYCEEGGKGLLICLYPAAHYYNGNESKYSEVAMYRSLGPARDPGVVITDIKVRELEIGALGV